MIVQRVWYYSGFKNFGDLLTLYILNEYGRPKGIKFIQCKSKKDADVIGIGSILHAIPKEFKGHVWTTGSLRANSALDQKNITWWGVRGKLTSALYNNKVVTGDGALLLSRLEKHTSPVIKKYKIGLIPHYVDYNVVQSLFGKRKDITILNVTDDPHIFIRKLRQCKCIFSSSLHGLIAADAFNIPNRQFRVRTSHRINGGMFKYRDYYSAFDLKLPKVINMNAHTNLNQWYTITLKYYQRSNLNNLQDILETITSNMLLQIKQESC